jgi:transposase
MIVLIGPVYISQKCSECGNTKHDLKLSDRIYHCNICNLTIDRDLNAAINILRMGLIKVGRGTPEFTPVETESIPEIPNPAVETGST